MSTSPRSPGCPAHDITPEQPDLARRSLFRATAVLASASVLPASTQAAPVHSAATALQAGSARLAVAVTINEQPHRLEIRPETTLLDLLREELQLTGTKKGCNRGECGACTVLLDGKRVNACLVLAGTLDGRKVTTIEGLAQGDTLHAVQRAFIACDAFQCGFCTSGQIMSAVACIQEGHTRSEGEIREWMSGNLCRCAGYPQITQAVAQAAKELEGEQHGHV